ncbi:MAG: ribonuclease P protein component [Rickettsiales bacterium]|jgi:ribonuclease P protein component|nr:ribonuclease P protein component [Rickettsiales bacterium]
MKILTIKARRDFLRVQRGAELSVKNSKMLILCSRTEEKYTRITEHQHLKEFVRIGFVITKKLDRRAVTRNRLRRRIKTVTNIILINHCNLYANHIDYIIILRRDAIDSSYLELLQSFKKLLSEIRIKYEH